MTLVCQVSWTMTTLQAMKFDSLYGANKAKLAIAEHFTHIRAKVRKRYWIFGPYIVVNENGWYLRDFVIPLL